MPKIITLPYGMLIDDVELMGTYVSLGNRQYEFSEITADELKNMLGSSENDMGLLCIDPNINKWAAFKPNRGIHPSGMYVDGQEIIYLKPIGTSTFPYDPGHFIGYNHTPRIPGVLGGISGNVPTYTTSGNKIFTEFVTLPEFDVRELSSNIDGVITKVSGQSDVFTTLTNDWQDEGVIGFDFEVFCNINTATTSVNVDINLGYLNGTTPVKFCNYPSVSGGQLTLSATTYNKSIPVLSGIYEPGDGEFTQPVIFVMWGSRSTVILDNFKLYRRKKLNGATFYDAWQLVSTQSFSSYEDEDISVWPSGTNYYQYYMTTHWKDGTSGTSNTITINVT